MKQHRHLCAKQSVPTETTGVKVAERFSHQASTFALGFSLGFLFTGVVGFLSMVGMRAMRHFLRLKRLLIH